MGYDRGNFLEAKVKIALAEGRGPKTGFFHRMANSPKRKNYLQKIKVDGVWLTKEADLK